MNRKIIVTAMLIGLAGPAAGQEKPVPEGLVCPVEIAGGERISVASPGIKPGVIGYCVYYLAGDTDFEALTMTLRIADSTYDWKASFKEPKIAKGGMDLVEETVQPISLGDGERQASVVTLSRSEEDLGPITETFSTLLVFELEDGRFISLEEEYNNLVESKRAPLREALLKAQEQ